MHLRFKDITISPGSHEIFGSVAASDVLPFNETENYASRAKYTYRFLYPLTHVPWLSRET